MGVVISQLCIDSTDPLPLARWWAEVLGWAVEEDDPGSFWVGPPHPDRPGSGPDQNRPGLLVAPVPEAKSVKNRLHLDLRPADGSSQEAELDRLLSLGARRVDVGQGEDVTWHVLADPEGNEFCLLRSTPATLRALLEADAEAQRAPAGVVPRNPGGRAPTP